ncbi:MAG TPA: SH3 domain-containing protein [Caldilineaceae bacterium]|nr:SH3 domain-containing protein [Caldilineaceae bacterium]
MAGLVAVVIVAGFVASPVPQPQNVTTLVERVDALETVVAEQAAISSQLEARLAELEIAVGIMTDASPPTPAPTPTLVYTDTWELAKSSDNRLTYRRDPDWILNEDEPGSLGFSLPKTGQALGLYWDLPPDLAQNLRSDETWLKEFQEEMLGNTGDSQLVSTMEVSLAGHEALALEFTATDESGFGARAIFVFYDCSTANSCGLVLMNIGAENLFTEADWQLLDAFVANMEFAAGAVANRNANLRSCPSTSCSIEGRVFTGQPLDLVAQNPDGTWYKLRSGEWIAAWLVDNAPENLPVIESPTGL